MTFLILTAQTIMGSLLRHLSREKANKEADLTSNVITEMGLTKPFRPTMLSGKTHRFSAKPTY